MKKEIHSRLFQTSTYTPDQTPSGIEKKVSEIQLAIQKVIGTGGITSIQYTGKGQYTVELKSKVMVQQVTLKGLHFPGIIQNVPLKPRRNHIILITMKTDASTLNQEIYEELCKYGKIININYGYYNNNNQIRDGRRLIHIIPTVDIDKIPPAVKIDHRIHQLYFRGKNTQPKPDARDTQKLLADVDILDSDEMSQDEDPVPFNDNPKEETEIPQTTADNKKHTIDAPNATQETPKNSKENTKTATQPPTTKDTKQNTAPTSTKRTTKTQKITETQKTPKLNENTKATEETHTSDATPPNTPMETDNMPNENTQIPIKKKSDTTPTKNDK